MPIDDRRVTLKDIAEKTGFTVNTVSQALRGSPKLREETKAAIRAAAKELGYVHNALAESLRSGSSRTIAIIVGDTSNLRFSIQLHAFELAFRTLGYQVIVMNTDETAQYELDAVKNAVRSSVDGVLLCPCQKSRAAIDLLESCRTPYVLFGRCYDDLPAVIWDDERGGYLAGQQLAERLDLCHGCFPFLRRRLPPVPMVFGRVRAGAGGCIFAPAVALSGNTLKGAASWQHFRYRARHTRRTRPSAFRTMSSQTWRRPSRVRTARFPRL